MAIERWDPFRDAISLRDAMNSLFQESFVRPGNAHGNGGALSIPLDVSETEDEYIVRASMPGVRPEDVQITVHGDTVTIRAESRKEEEKKGENWVLRERRSGSYQRSFSLGTPISADRATANNEHGILTLRLPKAEEAKPKQIKVGGGSGQKTKEVEATSGHGKTK